MTRQKFCDLLGLAFIVIGVFWFATYVLAAPQHSDRCPAPWFDMSSAPSDDSVVLEFDGDVVEIMQFNGEVWTVYGPSDHSPGNPPPMCWRPLPEGP